MNFSANAYSVTTALMVAFAFFVIYIRLKNWLHSNVPIFFYIILFAYMRSTEGSVPFLLIYTGFGLGLLLRFEFMNARFTGLVKIIEIGVLGAIIYFAMRMILS
jgi:hypothetical protein